MPLFIVTGLIGLLFFVGSLLFGDHDVGSHDHDFGGHDGDGGDGDSSHSGPSVLSVFNVAWFMIGFGGVGMILRAQDVSMPVSSISGVVTGAVCWALALLAMRFLSHQQADSNVTVARMKSAVGTVIMPISENGMGKIQVSVAGSSQEFIARSAHSTPLPVGSHVRITSDSGGVYMVEKV